MNNIKLKYFSDVEDFKGNMDKMDPKLLGMLDPLRKTYGFPIIINSSYRSPDHPIEAAKDKDDSSKESEDDEDDDQDAGSSVGDEEESAEQQN